MTRVILLALFFYSFLPGGFFTASLANDACQNPVTPLASCDAHSRQFRSVILAIPGWRGSCESTFGKQGKSIFDAIGSRRFFDVDCFDYDSLSTNAVANASALADHMEVLRSLGYREISLLTHSAGGVIALEMILQAALTSDGTSLRTPIPSDSVFGSSKTGMRIKALHAWAPPYNGVRNGVQLLIKFADWTPLNQTVLARDLVSGSKYLTDLKSRLKVFEDAIAKDSTIKEKYDFAFAIFSGKAQDTVVKSILGTDPWLPKKLNFKLVDSVTGHSSNVADSASGTQILDYRFPAFAESERANVELALDARFEQYFSADTHFTLQLPTQQRTIVDGIVNYTTDAIFFSEARKQISTLLTRLIREPYPRDPNFDSETVDKIRTVIVEKLRPGKPSRYIELADLMISEVSVSLEEPSIREAFRNAASTNANRFGGGNMNAARNLIDTLNFILNKVSELIQNNPQLESDLRDSDTLQEFQRRHALILDYLASSDDIKIQAAVRKGVLDFIEVADEQSIQQSSIVATLDDLSQTAAFSLDRESKSTLGQAYVTLARKSPELNDAAMESLLRPAKPGDFSGPSLWNTILSKEQVIEYLAIDNRSRLPDTLQFRFGEEIIRNAGIDRNQPDVGGLTAKILIQELDKQPAVVSDPGLRVIYRAAEESPFDSIRNSVAEELRTIDRDYLLTPSASGASSQ